MRFTDSLAMLIFLAVIFPEDPGRDGPQGRHAGVYAPDAEGAVRGPRRGKKPGGTDED